MTYKICFWNSETQQQDERDMTPEEEAQRLIDIAAAAAPVVPQKVTRRQALSALRINNITAAMVEAAIMAMSVTQLQIDLALIDFRESLEFDIDWPLIVPLCAVMGLNRDELFILAGSL